MTHDTGLWGTLLLGALVVTAVEAWGLRRGGPPAQQEPRGQASGVALRILAAVYFAVILLWLAQPAWLAATAWPLNPATRWFGVVVLAASLGLKIAAIRALDRGYGCRIHPAAGEHATLVTWGPFAWVRHPLYVSFTLDVLGLTLATANAAVLAAGAPVVAILVLRARGEDHALAARFPDEHPVYARNVGGFWPRFGKSR